MYYAVCLSYSFDLLLGGKTPLCASIRSVVQAVEKLASSLRQCNKRAAVIIATDGEATVSLTTFFVGSNLQYSPYTVWS